MTYWIPRGTDAQHKAEMDKAFHNSFINAYGKIMKILPGLGFYGR